MKSIIHPSPADLLVQVLDVFGLPPYCQIVPVGTGLINHTWLVNCLKPPKAKYILQRVNEEVFKRPWIISQNIATIGAWLKHHQPDYRFVNPIPTKTNQFIWEHPHGGWFRLFPFIEGSHTINSIQHPDQAYEAARQFGQFTRLLQNFPIGELQITLPQFHHLSLRYLQFEQALKLGLPNRIEHTRKIAAQLADFHEIVVTYEHLCSLPDVLQRVTHHDTKISNVLFDEKNQGICVIDLDTVMPGLFISDVGDMFRTYLCPVSEEEIQLGNIHIRMDYFEAMATGYLDEMGGILTPIELAHFIYAGKFMIYMQALRFYIDYITGDKYYPVRYETHNLIRTCNQLTLLHELMSLEPEMASFIKPYRINAA